MADGCKSRAAFEQRRNTELAECQRREEAENVVANLMPRHPNFFGSPPPDSCSLGYGGKSGTWEYRAARFVLDNRIALLQGEESTCFL